MAAKKTVKPISIDSKPAAKKIALPTQVAAVKKSPTKKTVSNKTTREKPEAPVQHSLDVIARAAYLNYRRRVENGLPGDSHSDWLEAERKFSR